MQDDGQQHLKLVASECSTTGQNAKRSSSDFEAATSREIDWTILMARAQDGDNVAYLRLLQEITPYLRSLVRRWHKDHWDIEDTVQDILLTLHSIRHTYDPARPFGPWLVGIANRRAIDRLRRRGRQILREAPLTGEHEATASMADEDADLLEKRRLTEALGELGRCKPFEARVRSVGL